MTTDHTPTPCPWQATLDQLALQLTKAVFAQRLAGTRLVSQEGDHYQIGVRDAATQEWLDHRLRPTIERALSGVVGGDVTLDFVVQTSPTPEPVSSVPPPAYDLGIEYAQQTDFGAIWHKAGGYAPVPHYVSQFWAPYLKAAAFTLWKYLDSTDKRPPNLPARWTPPATYRQTQLAHQLGSSGRRVITGGLIECAQAHTCRLIGQPRTTCCNRHSPHRFGPRKKDQIKTCYYWRPGALALLYHHHLLAVQIDHPERGTRNHQMQLQTFRVLPLLTPTQVAHLSGRLQEKHHHWLKAHERSLQLTYHEWRQISLASLVPYQPGYEQGRQLFGQPEFNPLVDPAQATILIADDSAPQLTDELNGIA